jgi:hypothetical protein
MYGFLDLDMRQYQRGACIQRSWFSRLKKRNELLSDKTGRELAYSRIPQI